MTNEHYVLDNIKLTNVTNSTGPDGNVKCLP